MNVPINWLKEYILLEHSNEEFGDIMTKLEFMQDGPIKIVNGEPVIDLEVRQNRPDVLSILGVAREYSAYTNEPLKYPDQIQNLGIEWAQPKELLNVQVEKIVKRFTAVEIENVAVKPSPEKIVKYLQSYGIPAINNVVDITNYVMLEYGIPMHAFDLDKLPLKENGALLNFRMANEGENFITWQGTKVTLNTSDLVVTDSNDRLVSIGGITGEAESGITNNTKRILLEAANYDYASVRRTAIKHNLNTESAIRHSKQLSSELVAEAIKRAAYLIQELAGGKATKIEDYYPVKEEQKIIEFNTNEVERLGGQKIEQNIIVNLLNRLGFEVKESQEGAPIIVKAPIWRTDINFEEDLVEEVWRLYGYEKIPVQEITAAPPKNITPTILILEDKIRDILVSLGLSEQITEPLVKYSTIENQIKLENPLNKDKDSLRTSIKETLEPVLQNYKKAKKAFIKIFEIGKVYYTNNDEYVEEKRVQALYENIDFLFIKSDLVGVFKKLGIENLAVTRQDKKLIYSANNKQIAVLAGNGFEIYTQNIVDLVDIRNIPKTEFETGFVQEIIENITFSINEDTSVEDIAKIIKESSDYINNVYIQNPQTDIFEKDGKKRITLTVVFKDINNKLNKETIQNLRNDFIQKIEQSLEIQVYSK